MSYFVTGATGFIGRYLVQELVENREGPIHVLCRAGSLGRMERLIRQWGSDRVVPVIGDLSSPSLGVDPAWVAEHRGDVEHFFHLAAIYDITADDATNDAMNIDGTRNALALAEDLQAGRFHQVSSVAAAGDYHGRFTEEMFDEGQPLPSPYHRTKFESEKIVREESSVPWRVYRPAIVVGSSADGAMDKIDGPYYLFPVIKRLRDALPSWLPMVGVDLGDTNVVPVDYVAKAMDHLAHVEGHDGEAFHLVNPEPQPVVDMINAFCSAAGAPQFATPIDRRVTGAGPLKSVPRSIRPSRLVGSAVRSGPVQAALGQTVGRVGIPAEVLSHVNFPTVFDSRLTEQALAGSGISVPPLETYSRALWGYWEDNLDQTTARDKSARKALKDKYVVITGASSGIGQVTALKVAQAGGIPVLVARGKEKLDALKDTIEMRGGEAHVFPCDLSDLEAIDGLSERLNAELPRVDFLVNNAGRSIRRPLIESVGRMHDFERTIQINYLAAVRMVLNLLPRFREQGYGHVINVSSVAALMSTPRFSAYLASKAALDAFTRSIRLELEPYGIHATTINYPLVKTAMTEPTKIYKYLPQMEVAEAAGWIVDAVAKRPARRTIPLATGFLLATAAMPGPALKLIAEFSKRRLKKAQQQMKREEGGG